MKRPASAQKYCEEHELFSAELIKLRKIVNSMGMEECIKWYMPVYVSGGKNIVGLFASKDYFGLWFYQGALLQDKAKVLVNAQEGKTKALRQWRLKDKKDIKVRLIKQYIVEAMGLAERGLEIKPNRNKPILVPVVLKQALGKNKKLKSNFEKLTKSRRREYAEYISEAKREETKLRRIEKIIPMILDSIGLNDKYR